MKDANAAARLHPLAATAAVLLILASLAGLAAISVTLSDLPETEEPAANKKAGKGTAVSAKSRQTSSELAASP